MFLWLYVCMHDCMHGFVYVSVCSCKYDNECTTEDLACSLPNMCLKLLGQKRAFRNLTSYLSHSRKLPWATLPQSSRGTFGMLLLTHGGGSTKARCGSGLNGNVAGRAMACAAVIATVVSVGWVGG